MERYHTIFRSESEFSANQACLQLEAEKIPVILSYNTNERHAGGSSFKVMVPERWQQRGMHVLLLSKLPSGAPSLQS